MKNHYGNKIHGYVIMPNHLHSLVYISEYSPDVSKLIQNAKRFQTYEIIDCLEEDNRKDLLKIFTEAAEFIRELNIKFLRVDLIPKKWLTLQCSVRS